MVNVRVRVRVRVRVKVMLLIATLSSRTKLRKPPWLSMW